ncbi:hypothetical protein [Nesterenkonia sedimenti]|uniref:hypothetical protein n=1 Tax=Nesterenkonia sedimenti TaxID=1463632 RepID=UPI001B3B2322|nr:hypothetical protein [Nesterenkonia sedimenti]
MTSTKRLSTQIPTLITLPTLLLLLTACDDGADQTTEEENTAEASTEETADSDEAAEDEGSDDEVDEGDEGEGLRVAVATNEPWGAYHVEHVADDVEARGGTIELIVPDMSEVDEEASVPSVPLNEADPEDYDLLVVNGAEEWPAEVAEAFEDLPLMASSTAYLRPEEAPHAEEIRDRLIGVTASSYAEQETFAVYLGVEEEEIEVVGVPEMDETPEWEPEADTVLILTSVTHPDETGGAAPGAELLLDAAHALDEEGYEILVGLHPREDESLWDEFEIAEEGSVEASARAEVAVGIPGSVFPRIAAVGTPLVGTVDPELDIPDYLTTTGDMASTVDEVLTAVEDAEPLSDEQLEYVVGPLGEAGPALVDAWAEAVGVED